MRVSAAKTAPRVERNSYMSQKRIKAYGSGNDYPQKILEIINSSGTGRTCMDIYVKFVEGNGFLDVALAETKLNSKGERSDSLLRKCAKDLKNFNGFAVLVKYNGLGLPDEYFNIPFEHCRLEIDTKKQYTGRIAVHNDWTGLTGVQFSNDDIKFINRYNPKSVLAEIIAAGSPEKYLGQIYYFTVDGDSEYPISPFDPVVTDMLTEESVSTVKHRNAKFNFLPSGILVRKGIKPQLKPDGTYDNTSVFNQEQEDSAAEIKNMQGDTNASKIWVVDIDADEEKPEFIEFTGKSYDRSYEYTEKSVQENIGKMFLIPPILRGVDVGAGFGAELMKNAYAFMNSVTGNERRMLETAFMDFMQNYPVKFTDFSIQITEYKADNLKIDPLLLPDLTSNERRELAGFEILESSGNETILVQVIGVGGTQALISIITDTTLLPEQKVQMLIKVFNFTDEEARKIVTP